MIARLRKTLSGVLCSVVALVSGAAGAQDGQPLDRAAERLTGRKPLSDLTPLQYHVTQQQGTERPFDNAYWDHKEDGIYVDLITGEPLFSSTDKFDSGTGWPSFTRPIRAQNVSERDDASHGMTRTEIKSSSSGAHLGHVFNDGPADAGGQRYCMNSAALRFVPKAQMQAEGYGDYLYLFDAE